jgi:hypothetical protein
VAWIWLLAVAGCALACSALLAAFSELLLAWAALFAAGLGVTAGWLGTAAVLSLRHRWSRRRLLLWAAWPAAVGLVGLLHATDLPLKLRVMASERALTEFVESGRTRGRAGLVVVFGRRSAGGCLFLTAGRSMDGIAGIVRVPEGTEPASHPDFPITEARRLTGSWWYFRTRT